MRINYENQKIPKLCRKELAIPRMVNRWLRPDVLLYGQNVRRRERGNYWRYRFFTNERATHRFAQPVEKTKQLHGNKIVGMIGVARKDT